MRGSRVVAWFIVAATFLFLGNVGRQAYAQDNIAKRNSTQTKDEYHRPDPSHPQTPQIPSVNRFRTDMVFLEKADSLYRPIWTTEEMQIVKGNVKFRQAGMWMFCDSAYYFPQTNSLDAFGNVRMEQGDTLFVFADKLYYDGFAKFAKLRCGPTRRVVTMQNREVTLTTDSLDYNLADELGWYAEGGQLEDSSNILTSIYGNYSPATKDADFFHNVVLRSKDDKFELLTDTLYYNTDTRIARIETLTEIRSENDTIFTRKGLYNTDTGIAELLSRSMVVHKDSLNRVTTLEGDSIIYDPQTRITRAYSFRDPYKIPTPMVINDTARKARLIGGFGIYNDSTREAMATEYPLIIEYSRPDTLYMRADTIRTWIVQRMRPKMTELMVNRDSIETVSDDSIAVGEQDHMNIQNDSIRTIGSDSVSVTSLLVDSVTFGSSVVDSVLVELHEAIAYPRARFFRSDLQGLADTIAYSEYDSLLRMKRLPMVWSEGRQINGDTIIVHFNDSTADRAWLPHKGLMMEHVDEDFYNQLSADKMEVWLEDGSLNRLESEGSVMTIFLPMENDSTYNRLVYAESSYLSIDMDKGDIDRLKMWPEVTGHVTPIYMVKNSGKLLPKAVWREALRPRREWYGGSWKWADDLGEIPEELEEYFGEAKKNNLHERRDTPATGLGGESDSGR